VEDHEWEVLKRGDSKRANWGECGRKKVTRTYVVSQIQLRIPRRTWSERIVLDTEVYLA